MIILVVGVYKGQIARLEQFDFVVSFAMLTYFVCLVSLGFWDEPLVEKIMKQKGVLSTSQPMSLIEAVFQQAKIANKTVSAFVRDALINSLPESKQLADYQSQTRRYHRSGSDSLTFAREILELSVKDEPVLARELMRKHRVVRVADLDTAANQLGMSIVKICGKTKPKKAYVKQGKV